MSAVISPLASHQIDAFVIHEAMRKPGLGRLDPVTVFLRDQEGSGHITVACSGAAWNCHFGSFGSRSLRQFIGSCDEEYLAEKLQGSVRIMSKKARKLENNLLQDIARSIIEVLKGGAA
jgi:hypothetical protein